MSSQPKPVHVSVTFRNLEASEAVKQYAIEKVTPCLQKFVHQDTEAHVVLHVEKKRQIAEITFNSDGASFHVSEVSEVMYKSIDALVDSLTTQLRKHKEKITKHH